MIFSSFDKPFKSMRESLYEFCDKHPLEEGRYKHTWEDTKLIIEQEAGLAAIFCAMVENYFIYRYRTGRSVYCYGIPDTGKTQLANYLDAVFYCVKLTVSDENFSIEDDDVQFYAKKY
jgi:hypothetical protein